MHSFARDRLLPVGVERRFCLYGGKQVVISFRQSVAVPQRVVMQEVEGESVVLNLDSEDCFTLDEVATRMWAVLTAAASIQEAYDALLAEYDVAPEVLRQDLEKLIGQLVESGLLELANG